MTALTDTPTPALLRECAKRSVLELEPFVRYGLAWAPGGEPSAQQLEVIRAIDGGAKRISVASGHGTGKTTLASWLILWGLINWDDAMVPCTAPTGHQLKDILWKEASLWHARLTIPEWREQLTVLTNEIQHKANPLSRKAVARTARRESPEALQGFHGPHIVFLIDEASGVPEEVFEVAEGALSTEGAFVILAGNPTRNSGYFYDSHNRFAQEWRRFTFNAEESELVDPAFPERMARKYGKDSNVYRVRVLGLFPRSEADALLSLDDIVEANTREYIEPIATQTSILGVDVARFGDDDTVLQLRTGDKAHRPVAFHGLDTMAVADRVKHAIQVHDPDMVNVDVIGVGGGVVDRLHQMGYDKLVTGVNVAHKADDKEQYDDLRSELWHDLARWVRDGGCLPDDRDLTDELASIKYLISSTTGRTRIESKDARKSRGLGSPDRGDALMLTFYTPPKKYMRVFSA